MSELIAKHQDKDDACKVSDLLSAEDDVPVCVEFADDKWDEEFDLGPANKLVCPESNSDEDSDYEDANAWEDTSPRLKSFDEAISCLAEISATFWKTKAIPRKRIAHILSWMSGKTALCITNKTDFNF